MVTINIDEVIAHLGQQIGQLTVNLSLKEIQLEHLQKENDDLVKQLEALRPQPNTDPVNAK